MSEKKLYAFCRLPEAKKELYNGLLDIKDLKSMTFEEMVLDSKFKRGKTTYNCPRIGSFVFEDGYQIYMDLTRTSKYDIDVCVSNPEGMEAVYEYEETTIQKVWEITPIGCDTTYVCVFLEKNNAKTRKAWFNTLSEAEYNVLDKILEKSHLCDIFEVQQDEYGDYIWCCEDNTKMSMKYGLAEICDAMVDWRECYDLSDEEVAVLNQLVTRYDLDYFFN